MSRIGKLPITVPKGVVVKISNLDIHIKGPHGEMTHKLPHGFSIEQQENNIKINRPSDSGRDLLINPQSWF